MPAIRTMARRVVSALDGAAGASSSSKPLASFRSHVAQPFGKPPVDRSEQIASLLPLALIAPEQRMELLAASTEHAAASVRHGVRARITARFHSLRSTASRRGTWSVSLRLATHCRGT
jgi:hypothetical protein